MHVSVVGAGLMGKGLVRNLLRHGYDVSLAKDRSAATRSELVSLGAELRRDTESLVRNTDVILTCLPSMQAVEDVFMGKQGIVANSEPGTLVIDCTTGDPAVARSIASKLSERGVGFVDAPLLGGPPQAWEGTVGLVVGGAGEDVIRARPLLEAISGSIVEAGEAGSGHVAKLINNAVSLTNCAIVYETFAVASRLGVDLKSLMQVMNASAAASRALDVVGPPIIADDHTTFFAISVAAKDARLYDALTQDSGVLSLVGKATRSLYQAADGMGRGQENVTRIYSELLSMADRTAPGLHPRSKAQ